MRIREIAKAIAATLTALGAWGVTALEDDRITGQEWFGLCGVAVVGITTWAVKNAAPMRKEG